MMQPSQGREYNSFLSAIRFDLTNSSLSICRHNYSTNFEIVRRIFEQEERDAAALTVARNLSENWLPG